MSLKIKEELLKGLTKEQIEIVREFDDVNDLIQLAKDEGVELTEEQLSAITGGGCDSSISFKEEEDK